MDVSAEIPTKHMIRFSVVYVNFHALRYIQGSIASLRMHHPDEVVDYVVVSNSRLDEADMQAWTTRPKHLNIIQLEANHGFAFANNVGVKQALGDYVFILNPDTLVHSPILFELESAWNRLEHPGVIGPLTRFEDGTIQNTVRTFYTKGKLIGYLFTFPLPYFRDRFLTLGFTPDTSAEVDVVNGSAMFFSKAVYQKLGGMDEGLFLYWEEDEICYRLKNSGYQIWFERTIQITHLESRIAKRENLDLQQIRYASKYHFLTRHHPDDVERDVALSVLVFAVRWLLSLVMLSRFRIRLNARLLRWHWNYLAQILEPGSTTTHSLK
jgi:GT2 family glycosyltransferase